MLAHTVTVCHAILLGVVIADVTCKGAYVWHTCLPHDFGRVELPVKSTVLTQQAVDQGLRDTHACMLCVLTTGQRVCGVYFMVCVRVCQPVCRLPWASSSQNICALCSSQCRVRQKL